MTGSPKVITVDASDFGLPEDENTARVFGERVRIPEFEMVNNPYVRISDVRRRRFNIIDRMQEVARSEIQANEDREVMESLGMAMAEPIRRNLDYQSIGRRIFDVEYMPMPITARHNVERTASDDITDAARYALEAYMARWSNNENI